MATIIINMNEEGRQRSFREEDFQRLGKLGQLVRYDNSPADEREYLKDLRTADAVLLGRGSVPFPVSGWTTRDKPVLLAHSGGAVHGLAPKSLLRQGVRISSAAAAIADSVAEFAVGFIIMGLRQAFARNAAYRRGENAALIRGQNWDGWKHHDLTARVVGLVGLSQVGRRMPGLLKPFGCRILAYDPYWSTADVESLGVVPIDDLDELIRQCHVVSLHTPVTEETRGMIGKDRIGMLREGAVFVNTARAACTDQSALFTRAMNGEIQAYVDVTEPEPLPSEHPAWNCPNIFITPHIAGPTVEMLRREGLFAVDEVERYLAGRALLGEITYDRYDIVG
jgi:phosphoglycerate dehydrogenase-like enzyme